MAKDPLDIPDFLRVSPEERKAAWEGRGYTDPHHAAPHIALEEKRRADMAAERKVRSARGLARIKEQHPNERWDRKRKIWVPK